MSDSTKLALFESAVLLEEARSYLVESYAEEKLRPMLTPKAVAIIADVLAILQDEVYKDGVAKVVGLDFPTRMGTVFHRNRMNQRDG